MNTNGCSVQSYVTIIHNILLIPIKDVDTVQGLAAPLPYFTELPLMFWFLALFLHCLKQICYVPNLMTVYCPVTLSEAVLTSDDPLGALQYSFTEELLPLFQDPQNHPGILSHLGAFSCLGLNNMCAYIHIDSNAI